jgi:hypothetical protein
MHPFDISNRCKPKSSSGDDWRDTLAAHEWPLDNQDEDDLKEDAY